MLLLERAPCTAARGRSCAMAPQAPPPALSLACFSRHESCQMRPSSRRARPS
jgi:hypothetical protein